MHSQTNGPEPLFFSMQTRRAWSSRSPLPPLAFSCFRLSPSVCVCFAVMGERTQHVVPQDGNLIKTPHLNLTAITSDIHRLVIHLYVCVTKGCTVDSLNGSWRYQKVMFHITAVSFTERWTRLQNTITKPILSEVLVPLEQQFRLTDFPLLRVYCICEIIPC